MTSSVLTSFSRSTGKLFSSGLLVLLLAFAYPPLTPVETDSVPSSSASVEPVEVDWRTLASLDYRTGEVSDELKAVDGKVVKIPGFTVPLEDWATSASELLLVPYVGACVHTPPPPPNQLVYVTTADGDKAPIDIYNPVWIEGVLKIENTESVYGSVGFLVEEAKVYPYSN